MSSPPTRHARSLAVGLGIGLLSAAIASFTGRSELARRTENTTYDLRVRQTAVPVDPSSPVVIVEINELSVRALEPIFGRWPWPRLVHGIAIDYLTRAGAKVVAYDVIFAERDTRGEFVINGQTIRADDSDYALVNAVRKAGNVVLGAEATFEGAVDATVAAGAKAAPVLPGTVYRPGAGFEERPDLLLPFEELARVARGVGHTYLARESDDSARRQLPFISYQGVAVPSLGVAAVLAADNVREDDVRIDGEVLQIGARRLPMLAVPVPPTAAGGAWQPSRQALIRFARPVEANGMRTTFPTYSFSDLLVSENRAQQGLEPAIPMAAFAGKVVFIGTSAAGMHDRYVMPVSPAGAPGVELHATLASNLLSGRVMRRASPRVDLALTIATGVAVGLVAVFLSAWWAMAVVSVLLVGLAWWLRLQVGDGLWIGAAMPIAAGGLALFGGVAWQYFVEGRQKRQIRQLFGRYVSKDVIADLEANPDAARLGGQRRDMTVLFSDIRGFTAASEKGSPEAVVEQLNEYFGRMVEVLFRYHGTLDKFVGDMVMGLFGAPIADPRHADHAVATAIEMSRELDRLNEGWRAAGKPVLDIGIGINSGEMIAGNIGSEAVMSYTVIGDAVNLGSRIESLNKDFATRILISEATRDRLTSPVETRLVGEVTVKGRSQPVRVHEVIVARSGT